MTVRVASSERDVCAIQSLRHRLLGSFAGTVAGFREDRHRLVEPEDVDGIHVAAFDHRNEAVMAVRLDALADRRSYLSELTRRELGSVGVNIGDGGTRSISDRLHVTPGIGGHLIIRMLAKMMEQARQRGWVGDLCRCDPEHFEIRRNLGYRSLGVFASSEDGRYPTSELMYLHLPRSLRGMG